MVAAPHRSSRARAVALALVMLLPAAALLAPPAQASHSPTVTLQIPNLPFVIGDTITFYANITMGSCIAAGSGVSPTVSGVTLDEAMGKRIGHQGSALAFTGSGNSWTLALPVNAPVEGNRIDGTTESFEATASITCTGEGSGTFPASDTVFIDNNPPVGPVRFTFENDGRYSIRLESTAEVDKARADLSAIGGSATHELNRDLNAQPQTINATSPGGRATVRLSDANRATATFMSAAAPAASLQVYPLAGGIVRVEVGSAIPLATYGFAIERPTSVGTWTVVDTTSSLVESVSGTSADARAFDLAASLFTQNQVNKVRVFLRDSMGDGVPSDAKSVTPAASPTYVTLDSPPTAPTRNLGTLTGESAAASSGTAEVKVALKHPNGWFWQNDALGTFDPAPHHEVATRAADGTWSIDVLNYNANTENVVVIPNGTYTLLVELYVNGFVAAEQTFPVIIDRKPVDVKADTKVLSPAAADGLHTVHQGAPLGVQLVVEDDNSSIRNVSFQLRHTSTGNPRVAAVGGGLVNLECLKPACLTAGDYGSLALTGAASAVLPNAPIGTYQLVALVYDQAGNEAIKTFSPNVRVVPAVQVRWPQLHGDVLHMQILGEYRAAQSLTPSEDCAPNGYTCKLTEIRIFGRNGGTGSGSTLAILTAPHAAMETDGGRGWWNYTLDSGIGTGSLNQNQPMQVRAVARAQIAPGTADASFITSETGWLPVTAPTIAGAMVVRYPPVDWRINQTGSMRMHLTFNQTDLPSEPFVETTLTPLTPGGTGPVTLARQYANAHAGNVRPKASYNYSVDLTGLANGQYAAQFSVYTNDSKVSNTVLGSFTRYFAVQTTAPAVHISNVTQTSIVPRGDNWVPSQFILNAYVDPGQANVSTAGLDFRIQRNVRGTGATVLNNSEDGFRVVIDNPQDLNPIDKDAVLRLNVTLPNGALNGDVFTLLMSVKSDANEPLPPGTAWRNMTNITFPLRLDLDPPSGGLDLPETNNSALQPGELAIFGFATDAGAGVGEVQVRVVNLSSNMTFDWRFGNFMPGDDLQHWATSRPVRMPDQSYVRDVIVVKNVTSATTHTLLWSVNETNRSRLDEAGNDLGTEHKRLPLERGSHYRVDVRVIDRFGRVHESSRDISLDPEGPKIVAPLVATPGPYLWHGSASMYVHVSDNWCIWRVSLMARTDTGREHGPAEFRRPNETGCYDANATAVQNWTIDLRDHPSMTDEVANYTYWVRVTDASGNVTETPVAQRTVKRAVLDSEPAQVKFLRLEPPVIGPGQRSRIVAEIFEVHGIDRVRVFLHRIVHNTSYELIHEAVMRPSENVAANGTGEWIAESDTDLEVENLTLGHYLWEVRPMDKNWEMTCLTATGDIACDQKAIILTVSSDAGVFIQPEAPSAGTSVVNGTPVFRWRVFHKSITASGIAIHAGNSSADLAPVAPTSVVDMPPSGSTRTGVIVEYRPNVTGETFAVRLLATAEGVTNQSELRTFTVDAIAPTVNATYTNVLDIGGRNYTTSQTRVNVTAADASPIAITYTVNGGAPQAYVGNVTPTGDDGEWRFDYTATDAAGNAARGSLTLHVDKTGPVLRVSKHGDEILLTVTDAGAGLNESSVRVHYAYGNEATFTTATFQKVTGNSFRAQLTGNATSSGVRYHFEAKDVLGNTGTLHSASAPYTIDPDGPASNLEPTLQITSPAAGASVRQKVELRWAAGDPEGENVTITIALRMPNGQGRILQTAGPNNRSYVVDLTGAPAGSHTLVVTASDGEKTAQESVSFVVERGEVLEVLTPPPTQVTPNGVVPFAMRVNSEKPVATVTYRLVRADATVETGELKPTTGGYSANIVPTEAGRYGILVTVAYADGTSEPEKEMGSFLVAGGEPTPAAPSFPASLMTLVVLALVTVALAAYAAFVRWGR